MSNPVAPFAVLSGEGTLLETPTGGSVTIKAHTGNTNGSMTVLEFVLSPKEGPALHIHLREDELWYVLDGDFRFKAGDALFQASKGDMAFGPRGMPHCFQNVGDAPARLLVITTPSGLERFFEEYAELLPGPVDSEMLSALGHANWVEFVGPPLKVSDPTLGVARRHRAAVELVAIAATPEQSRPHRPCHYRAIHSGPDWSPADNHGQRHSDLDLRRFLQSQVTNRADLALQAGGPSRGSDCAGRGGGAASRPAPAPATTDGKPPSSHEDHDLRLED